MVKDSPRRKALIFCGPTAAGKSAAADEVAGRLSEACGTWAPVVVVDSMQVYREIPMITNQARERPAELVGIVSVEEEWTVARHKERAEGVLAALPPGLPFVLDAGTGMYLNAIVLDVPLAPKVPEEVRAEAGRLAEGSTNPRRMARELELGLAGAPGRGSIWGGGLRYDAAFVYLRPPRHVMDANIALRSRKISREGGAEEAERLKESGLEPNASVREAIGVKEMLLRAADRLRASEAEEAIATRTRRLARRQVRWFDKLVRCLPDTTEVLVVEDAARAAEGMKHFMHGRMGS